MLLAILDTAYPACIRIRIYTYMFGEGSVAEGNFTEREPLTRVSSTVSSLSRGRREREGANVRREDSGRGWRGAINASRGM